MQARTAPESRLPPLSLSPLRPQRAAFDAHDCVCPCAHPPLAGVHYDKDNVPLFYEAVCRAPVRPGDRLHAGTVCRSSFCTRACLTRATKRHDCTGLCRILDLGCGTGLWGLLAAHTVSVELEALPVCSRAAGLSNRTHSPRAQVKQDCWLTLIDVHAPSGTAPGWKQIG